MTAVIEMTHTYKPRGTAQRLFSLRAPEVLVSGPAGTGKSRSCLEKLHLAALLNPRMHGLIVRKTAVSLTSSALKTWREHVAPESLLAGDVEWYGGSSQEPAQYRYSNGSTISVAGMDKASKIMSTEFDMIYVQEATELDQEDWQSLLTRLRNGRMSFQQIIADCNPSYPTHWLKKRCDSGRTIMLNARHEENPVYFNDAMELTPQGDNYLQKLDSLTGVTKERLYEGKWVAAEGMIFDDFKQDVHVLKNFTIPYDWPRYWAIDFGFTNPFVLQCWAVDPDDRLYLYREIYQTRKTVDQHAKAILAEVLDHKDKWIEPKPRAIICDHDAEDRATLRQELGLETVPAVKAVQLGIQAVQRRLRLADDHKPRIYLLENSRVGLDGQLKEKNKPTCLVEEIPGYIWDPSPNLSRAEEPLKENDHGCDAMRYMVAHMDLGKKSGIRII